MDTLASSGPLSPVCTDPRGVGHKTLLLIEVTMFKKLETRGLHAVDGTGLHVQTSEFGLLSEALTSKTLTDKEKPCSP